jgi:hypothetical protein
MRLSQLKQFKQQLLQIAAKHGVKQVYVFGSIARGEAIESSDVDLLIEMDSKASALSVGGFQYETQSLLGTRVDVVPTFALNQPGDKDFAETIRQQAVPL